SAVRRHAAGPRRASLRRPGADRARPRRRDPFEGKLLRFGPAGRRLRAGDTGALPRRRRHGPDSRALDRRGSLLGTCAIRRTGSRLAEKGATASLVPRRAPAPGYFLPDLTVFSTSATSRGAPQERHSRPSLVTRNVSSIRTPMFHHFGSTPSVFAGM